ncbi:GNAT family N-acetyltransferase [Streptomyces geranii]|uniref:GNAT family N-acetyltransferase n=1 Tax=Streptomyces geranii TaxID=2058923 RepID=UPI000D03B378|nr:GNAT family N-acetyltransferase [Streptomyces geranii]
MRSDGWHLTEDVHEFCDRAGEFLRSRPALHTTTLTTIEQVRTNGPGASVAQDPVFGRLEEGGEVTAAFFRLTPERLLSVTPLTYDQADGLAAHLVAVGQRPPGVSAVIDTATTFAEAWQRHTGSTSTFRTRIHLYRLGTLTPPQPVPAGRGRPVGEADHEHLMQWCREAAEFFGEDVTIDADTWAGTRFAEKTYTYWETPDGTPVSMAGVNPLVGGQVRVDPVYTPAHLRGHGYAAAATAEVTRAALAAGATDVVLYTDPNNPTSNALYQRLGYQLLTDWGVYVFTYPDDEPR